jgi:lambda family phage portal protein
MANLLDRVVGAWSPQRGLARARARVALDRLDQIHTEHKFRYDGARSGRRVDGWYTGSGDATSELMGALVWLRDRSRDLVRNNPYAAKAIEELVGNTVGTGISPNATSGNDAVNKIINDEWPYFVESCDLSQRLDFYSQQAIVVRTMAESGESIARWRPRPARSNLRIPLQIQILESDYIDHNRNSSYGSVPKNASIIQGVEFDSEEARIAYWLFNEHPGGVASNPRAALVSQRVPAYDVMHAFRTLRPGQVRGVPWLASVMIAMRDLDDYCDAERVRKKTEACLAGIVTQAESETPTLGPTTKDGLQRVEHFEPGMIAYLHQGEDIKFNNPPTRGGYREYKISELQTIASGTGVPYEMLASDMSLVNYSSYRAGQLGFRNTISAFRWMTLIPLFCQPARRRFIDTLVLLGKIPQSAVTDPTINLYSTDWTSPRWESVDPLKDARAQVERIRSGVETLFTAISANGGDPNSQLIQISKINQIIDKLGLVLDSDPRYTNLRGVSQPLQAEQNPKIPGKPVPGSKGTSSGSSNQSAEDGPAGELLDELEAELFEAQSLLHRNGVPDTRTFS